MSEDSGADPSRYRQAGRTTSGELTYRQEMERLIASSPGTLCERMENFTSFVSRQTLARFLALSEIFKEALPVQGDIIECGVHWGAGLMAFAQLSAIHEPVNLQRRVIGFDTFAGHSAPSSADRQAASATTEMRAGGLKAESYESLQSCIALYDRNRSIGHVPKVMLVKGDARTTMPEYLSRNPHTVVSLLHLDFDLEEPTAVAIDTFLPRMPRGAVLVFDELNNTTWPGETVAVHARIGLQNLRIRRFPFEPHISFAVL